MTVSFAASYGRHICRLPKFEADFSSEFVFPFIKLASKSVVVIQGMSYGYMLYHITFPSA